jgi:hypothetical protein
LGEVSCFHPTPEAAMDGHTFVVAGLLEENCYGNGNSRSLRDDKQERTGD